MILHWKQDRERERGGRASSPPEKCGVIGVRPRKTRAVTIQISNRRSVFRLPGFPNTAGCTMSEEIAARIEENEAIKSFIAHRDAG